MSKPRHGRELKKAFAVRIEPSVLTEIVKQYGSFSAWINIKIKEDDKLETQETQDK